jgi:hypothetical protein
VSTTDLRSQIADALWAQARVEPGDLTDVEVERLVAAAAECGPASAVEAFLEGDLDG